MGMPLPVVNLETATFDCIFGRGCDGICCKEGEPPVHPEEIQVIADNLDRIVPHLRPEAAAAIAADGFLDGMHAVGLPKLRVSETWCVFFNQGCVLHKLGATEGRAYHYKPSACALFPLARNDDGDWKIRQWGHDGEGWDLFCLNPSASPRPAAESLKDEIALAHSYDLEAD